MTHIKCVPESWPPYGISIFACITSAVLAVIASSGNGLIIITVIKDPLKQLRRPFVFFLVNLAVSDAFQGLIMLPVSSFAHYREAVFEDSWVPIAHILYFVTATNSLLSLIALSVDRLIAITLAAKYKEYVTFRRCLMTSVGIWMVSISFPFIQIAWDYVGYLLFFAHTAILVGLTTMAITSVRISRFMRHQADKMVAHRRISAPSQSSLEVYTLREKAAERKVTRTFNIITSVFIAFYIPAVIMIYVAKFCEQCGCQNRMILLHLQFLFISANSSVNPIIYASRVSQFRRSIKAVICRRTERA